MFRKIVVGVDAREGDQDAISLARALAPEDAIVLANAYPYDDVRSRFANPGYQRALRDDVLDAVRGVREQAGLPDAPIELIGDTSPERGLERLAESLGADLVVVASAHRGPVGRALLGDVSRGIMHRSPCPVAVAPRGWTRNVIRRIGVAFDGSPESRAALGWAARLAGSLDAGLRVRHAVLGPLVPARAAYALDLHEIQEEMLAGARAEIDEALAALDPPADAKGDAVIGTCHEVLEGLAEEVDVLVTGSRGWGTLRSVVLGSTSDWLIHHAACPVVVVPRGVAEPEGSVEASVESTPAP
jgi:nucleotide-binding universal stress UspA family protein